MNGGGGPAPPPRGAEGGGVPEAGLSIMTWILLYVVVVYAIVTYFREGGNDVRKGRVDSNNTEYTENISGRVESNTSTAAKVVSESLMDREMPAADIIGSLGAKEGKKSYSAASLIEEVDENGFPIEKTEDYESSGSAAFDVVEVHTAETAGKGLERMEDMFDDAVAPERIKGLTQHSILVQYCMS